MGNLAIKYSELQAELPTHVSCHYCLTLITQLCQAVLSLTLGKQANPSIMLCLKGKLGIKITTFFPSVVYDGETKVT